MHSRKVFPLKDLNYAASKTSTTFNTALNPADLRDGAIGIYGIHRAGATNLNKLVLITDGGSEVAGAVPAASFVGEQIQIAMGVAVGPSQLSNPIDKTNGIRNCKAKIYTAPVLGVWRVGYNGVAGSSTNFPATVVKGDDFSINVTERNYIVAANREPFLKKSYSVGALANGESVLTVLYRWIAYVSALPADQLLFDKLLVKLVDNGTGSVFTTSATVAAVNGATTLTTSAAHGVVAGNGVRLNGDYYVAVTGTTGSTLVLDRPYQGATGTIANANTLNVVATATLYGIELTDKAAGQNLVVGSDGALAVNATKKQMTAPLIGSGTQQQVQALEYEALPKKGSSDFLTSYMKKDIIRATGTYDLYIFEVHNANHPNGDPGSVFKVTNYLTLAFVSGVADTTTFAQSDFEDAMISLFGATVIPAIS